MMEAETILAGPKTAAHKSSVLHNTKDGQHEFANRTARRTVCSEPQRSRQHDPTDLGRGLAESARGRKALRRRHRLSYRERLSGDSGLRADAGQRATAAAVYAR